MFAQTPSTAGGRRCWSGTSATRSAAAGDLGWLLSYDAGGNRNPEDYIVGLGLPDVDAVVAQAREYLRSVGYPAAGRPSS